MLHFLISRLILYPNKRMNHGKVLPDEVSECRPHSSSSGNQSRLVCATTFLEWNRDHKKEFLHDRGTFSNEGPVGGFPKDFWVGGAWDRETPTLQR